MNQDVITRVQRLRRLAERTSSVHEAQAAAAQAERLIAQHALSEAQLEADTGERAERAEQAGDPLCVARRTPAWCRKLASVMAHHYGCSLLYRGTDGGTATVVFGRASDVSALRYMYAWVVSEISRLAAADGGDRTSFAVGALIGYARALVAARQTAVAAHSAEHGDSAALVLVGRVAEATAARDAAAPDAKVRRERRLSARDAGSLERGRRAGEEVHQRGAGGSLPGGGVRSLGA